MNWQGYWKAIVRPQETKAAEQRPHCLSGTSRWHQRLINKAEFPKIDCDGRPSGLEDFLFNQDMALKGWSGKWEQVQVRAWGTVINQDYSSIAYSVKYLVQYMHVSWATRWYRPWLELLFHTTWSDSSASKQDKLIKNWHLQRTYGHVTVNLSKPKEPGTNE